MRKTTVLLLLALAIALALPGVAGAASNDHVYRRDNEEYPFHWGADLFEERSQIYDNDLAVASAVLSWGVEVSEKQQIQDLFAGLRIENLYTGCYDGGQSYKTWQEWGWGFQDGVFAIGHYVLTMDSANDTTLLVVVGRGTMTPGEMRTDFFNTGNGSRFVAGKTVKQNISTYQRGMWLALEDYLRVHPVTTPKVKMLITGHSLGGAMANLFGAKIIHDFDQIPWLNGKATQDDIYVYTFGAIKVLDQEQNVSQGYENIHNIYNKYDTFGPEGKNTLRELDVSSPNAKFGHTDLFARVFEEGLFSTNAHNMDAYLFALAGGDMVHCAFSEAFEQDESDGVHDETIVLSREDTLALLASVSDTPLMAASGAGAWEGRLKINADATFSGYYYDKDADVIYESSFSGSLNPYAEVYGNRYWLWVNEVTTRQTPGTTAMSEYGIPVIYEEAPLRERDYVVLTLPGTPDGEIPETVREEIGGVLGEGEDYSRFITLTRWDDGWGFFADPDDPPDFDPVPAATAAPDPTPAVSRNGDVLVDDEICTIVNLGREIYPALPIQQFQRPGYCLAITNHLDHQVVFDAGTYQSRHPGTVNGLKLDTSTVLNYVAIPAGETAEMHLVPVGYGTGFRSVQELVNADLFIHAVYGEQSRNYRDYELRMDAGPAYPYPDAAGNTAFFSKALGISFEIPDNWTAVYETHEGVTPKEPDSALYSYQNSTLGIALDLLNTPALYDNGIYIHANSPGLSQDTIAGTFSASPDAERAEDIMIDGHRACVVRQFQATRYMVTNDDGLVLTIWINQVYGEPEYRSAVEHFLNTFRFTSGGSQPAVTAAPVSAPSPAPDISKGDVLVDDEICTIVNLSKDMHPAIGDLFPRPFYRLAVTNHLDREIIFRPGTRDGRKLGTVNGLQIRAAVSGAGGGVLSGEKQVAVPAKQTVEIILRPEGYGVGFRSVDELANTDLFVHVLYGNQAGNGREYELRMDAGAAYRYPDAMGYAICSPECLGISFEIPDNWEVCFVTGDGVSKEAPESAVYSNGFGGQYGITMEILNQPTLYDNGIFIGVETAGTQDELADNYAWSEQRLEDTVIGGRRACRLRFSDYDRYGRYLVTNDDGLVLNILIREGYRESAFLDIIEHFLNTFRFTPGDSRPDETADETAVSWPGIWRARRQDGESRLYIFPYEWGNGTYDVILSAEKNGSAVAAAGMIYRVDEITMEFYADGLLDAGLVQAPGIGLISLTPFSAMNDALLPWLESIEADYEYIGPLDDPDRQIPSYVWDLTRQREYPAEGSVSFTLPPAFSDNDWMRDAVGITDPTIDPGMIYTAQTPVPSAAPMPTASLASAALVPIPGKRGCLQVPVSRVDATSHIVGSRDPAAYAPVRMLDGEETTAFQFSTGTTPLGQAYLSFDFDGPVTLDELWIKNGFWKITDGLDQYTRNSRIKKMTIFVRFAGADGDLPLREATLADDPARRDWQTVSLPGAQNITGVRIRVDEIYTGSRFPTDVCISEIMFVRRAEQ